MFPDVGLPELLVIGLVALLVVKPEELPDIMRKFGVFTATARSWVQGMWMGVQEVPPPVEEKPRKVRRKRVVKP